MRNKFKFKLCIMFVIICSLLTGCSLAVENGATNNTTGDKLIGLFVTKEHLILEDKLYATENSKDESGISFGDTEGRILLRLEEKDENDEPYSTTKCSEGIFDVHTAINVTDNGEEVAVSAKIYAYPMEKEENIIYANPIYQTADERIYTMSGSGYFMSYSGGEGEQFGTSFSTETKENLNGESKIEKSTVEIKYVLMYKPVEITLYQMDEKNQVIVEEKYEPGKLPEEIKAEKDTAYFLIETKKQDLDGNEFYMRDIFEEEIAGDNYLDTYCAMGNGILSKQETKIVWSQ